MEVTPLSVIPQGTIHRKALRSGETLRAKPWLVTQRDRRTPMAAIFSSPTHTPVSPGTRPAWMPKSPRARIITSSRSRT